VCVCVCVCGKNKENNTDNRHSVLCLCVQERESERYCVCVRLCVCVCMWVCVCVCVCFCVCVCKMSVEKQCVPTIPEQCYEKINHTNYRSLLQKSPAKETYVLQKIVYRVATCDHKTYSPKTHALSKT